MEDEHMNVAIQNDNYTKLGESTKAQIEKQIKEILASLLCREDVNSLIDEFIKEPSDVKASIENKIIEKLIIGNSFTNYEAEHGSKPVCDYDKGNDSDVRKVSEKYRTYANKLPSNGNKNIDKKDIYEKKIIEILLTILEGCKTSGDYITRLVNRRINKLSPELKNEDDSTRLLIFKQALKALEFPDNSYFSKELTKYICEITGISKKSSNVDIIKAISLLTDDTNNSKTNVFDKLDEINSIISDAKKDYDELVIKYAEKNEEYKIKKREYDSLSSVLSKEKKSSDKDKEKAEKDLNKAKEGLKKIKQAIERDEKKFEKETKEETRKKIENRISEAKEKLINAEDELRKATSVFEEASEKSAKIENEYNDENSKYNTLKKDYEALAVEKEDISKKKDKVENKHKDLQKKYNKNWAPLMWADDIAKGFFNDQQTTRRKIYWFAIIFEMTFYSGAVNEIEDPETDIQKNLFYDFYADNLLNNLLVSNTDDLKRIEKEPSGHGINFKNYAEAIYLYYLSRHNMTPLEKMVEAENMIERCKTKDNSIIDKQTQNHVNKNTVLYESEMSELLSISTDDKDVLYEYIRANYICGTTSNTTPMRVDAGNKTAAEIYKDLIRGLKTVAIEIDQQIESSDELSYIDDELECKSSTAKQMITLSLLVRETLECVEDRLLKDLLEKIEEKFHCVWKKKTIEECIDSTFLPKNNPEEDVSRTKLIVLYYFLVGLEYLNEGTVFNDFEKFYDEFCENKTIIITPSKSKVKYSIYDGLNSCLAAAGYQEINPKNIFDITVLFFAYKKFMDISGNY